MDFSKDTNCSDGRGRFFGVVHLARTLNEWAMVVVALMFGSAVVVVLCHIHGVSARLARETALQNVAVYADTLNEFQTLYATEVLKRRPTAGDQSPVEDTGQSNIERLPSTICEMLSQRLSSDKVAIRAHVFGIDTLVDSHEDLSKDEFRHDALAWVQTHLDEPMYRFEELLGRRWLRFATAAKTTGMEKNIQPQVLEIALSLDEAAARTRNSMQSSFLLLTVLATLGLVGLGIVFRSLRHSQELAQQSNAQLTEVNRDLERKHEQLTSLVQSVDQKNEALRIAKAEAVQRAEDLELANRKLEDEIGQRRQAQEALVETERQLRRGQKLEAIGQLSAGVAHEFNNLLQAIRGYTGFAMDGLSNDDHRYQDLKQVVNAAERASTITRQLLSFSRRDVLQSTQVEINQVVKDMLSMLRPLIGEHIELHLTLAEKVDAIHADTAMMEQVLLNLCVNARDAMPDGGQLSISTRNVVVDGEQGNVPAELAPGNYIVLTVSDSGCGISKEVIERIFDPFFTTKDVGKGTGLGLAMVYGIVQQHAGAITAESAIDRGTTFQIYLPAVNHAVAQSENQNSVAPPGGSEMILVAEDDSQVRELATRILNAAGYRTVTANNGLEAVQRFEEHQDEIALLLLDVIMPKMTGHSAYREICSLRPDISVLFCTGYDPERTRTEQAVSENVRFVQKPFKRATLLQTIRDVLDQDVVCQSA